ATFTFTGSDNVTPSGSLVFQASLDGAAFATVSSPATYNNLSQGAHTFQVKDVDEAGNVSSVASYSFTVHTTAPTVSITHGPPATGTVPSATFTFTGSDDVTPASALVFRANLDGAAFTTVTSPATYNNLSLGDHTFQVKDFDQAGNVSSLAS